MGKYPPGIGKEWGDGFKKRDRICLARGSFLVGLNPLNLHM